MVIYNTVGLGAAIAKGYKGGSQSCRKHDENMIHDMALAGNCNKNLKFAFLFTLKSTSLVYSKIFLQIQ